jgi:ribosomal-protein-serine acetyltransferase
MELVVRELTEDDAAAVTRAVHESLEHLRRWLPWAQEEPHDVAWRREFVRAVDHGGGDRLFGAFLGDDLVGCCGLHARLGAGGREIGYWVHVDQTGRGIATEMARRLVAVAFEDPGVTYVEIHHEAANRASGRVPEKLGFAPQARLDERGHHVWRLPRDGRPAAP